MIVHRYPSTIGPILLLFLVCLPLSVDGILLHGMDLTIFNFLSDNIATIIQTIFTMCMARCYYVFISQHLKKKYIPLRELGKIPENMFQGIIQAWVLKLSLPVVLIAVLVSLNQFSHAIADLGLKSVITIVEGTSESILSLETSKRNVHFLYQGIGDPRSSHTSVAVAATLYSNLTEEQVDTSQKLERNILSFTYLVDAVAKGTSPLLSKDSVHAKNGKSSLKDESFYGGIRVGNILHAESVEEDAFLVGIDIHQPLECSNMSTVDQSIGLITGDIRTETAMFPSCASYDSLRSTGIYENTGGRAEITSYLVQLQNVDDPTISIVSQNKTFHRFSLMAKSRALARDRDDYRQGRLVENIIDTDPFSLLTGPIEAIQIGSIVFNVGAVTIATGKSAAFVEDAETEVKITQYGLIAEIEGDCPEDPSGKVQPSCIAVVTANCETFPEDLFQSNDGISPNEIIDRDSFSTCVVSQLEILWGRNFAADRKLAAVVGGMYGSYFLATRGIYDSILLMLHLVPAAMVMMASTDELPSQRLVVTPSINALYIIFMVLPLVLAGGLFITSYWGKNNSYVIPDEPWKLAIVGNESTQLPHKRVDCKQAFPEKVGELQYGVIGCDPISRQIRLGIMLPKKTKSKSKGTPHSPCQSDCYATKEQHPATDVGLGHPGCAISTPVITTMECNNALSA